MTREQATQIRQLVNAGGWSAVHKHPELGKVWAKALVDQRRTESAAD